MCYACFKREEDVQIRHVNGTPVLLCKMCRAIWYDIRHGIVKRYGTLSNSKKSRQEAERCFNLFVKARSHEKVVLT